MMAASKARTSSMNLRPTFASFGSRRLRFGEQEEGAMTREQLRESNLRLRLMLSSVAQAVWEADAAGMSVVDSPSWREFTGQTLEECRGDGWIDAIHPDDRDDMRARWQDAVQRGALFNAECRLRHRDEGYCWTNVRAAPLHDPQGRVIKWLGVNIGIHERKLAEQALREADARKDEFLATLAHELRNPLAPIRHGLEVARRTASGDARLQPVFDMMERQVGHLVRLVEDLLDVGRISSGRLELQRAQVDVAELLARSVEDMRNAIECRELSLEVSLPPQPVCIQGDVERLAQVFMNLLANAAKFSSPGGRIRVVLRTDDDDAVVEVHDTGVGIPADQLEQVFDLFSQVHAHRAQSEGGLGIGLSLVQRLVRLHGGTVTAASAGCGQGSTLTVRLPLA
jgi:PAS domain S-box-containing protein